MTRDCKSLGFGLRRFESYFQHHFGAAIAQSVERIHGKATVLQLRLQWREVPYISNITGLCRLSSVVEHVHGKDGVVGSNPTDGSI